jgi:polyisoprenoid-binding protein YceI
MRPVDRAGKISSSLAALLLVLAFPLATYAADAPLDAKLTSLKFTGHAFLHSFEGQAQDFEGGAQVDPADPNYVTTAVIDIATAKMTTFQATRDRNMKTWLDSSTNPRIEYRLDKLTAVSGDPATATKEHPATFTVQGYFTLNRTTRPLVAKVIGWREKGLLIVTGTTTIDTTDYGLPIIKEMFMTVDKDVDVTFRLVFDLPADAAK